MTPAAPDATTPPLSPIDTYEARLGRALMPAFLEASMHFEERSAVFQTMRKITRRLDELAIPYAVVGAMAMFAHGYRRFTEGVDLLVTAEGLAAIHQALDGLGYLPPFKGSKQLRDVEFGVRIEFLVAGGYPGDGKPKPVAFPDPALVAVEIGGIRYLSLPTLIDLKLASGMTGGVARLKDLGDVAEIIRLLDLPASFGEQLSPYTRDKFAELWNGLRSQPDVHDETPI